MRIEHTAFEAGAQQSFERTERIDSRREDTVTRRTARDAREVGGPGVAAVGAISEAAREALSAGKATDPKALEETSNGPTDPKLLTLIALVERMTGERVRVFVPSSVEADAVTEQAAKAIQRAAQARDSGQDAEPDPRESRMSRQIDVAV